MLWSKPSFHTSRCQLPQFFICHKLLKTYLCAKFYTEKNVVLVYKFTCHQEVKPTTATGCCKHRQGAQPQVHTSAKGGDSQDCCARGNSFELDKGEFCESAVFHSTLQTEAGIVTRFG